MSHNLPTLPDLNPRYELVLTQILDSDLNADERNVARLIGRIPYGQIASYKAISEWAQHKYGYSGPRNVAKLREKLYELLGRHTGFPLWRLASQRDEHAKQDSIQTRIQASQERTVEGSWDNPVWFEPLKYHDPY